MPSSSSSSSSSSRAYSLEDMRQLVESTPKSGKGNGVVAVMRAVLMPDELPGLEKERADIFPFFLFLIHQNGGGVTVHGKKLPPAAVAYIKLSDNKGTMARHKWYMEQFVQQVRHNLGLIKGTSNAKPASSRKQIGSGFDLLATIQGITGVGSNISDSYVAYTYANISKNVMDICIKAIDSTHEYADKWTMHFIIFAAAIMSGFFYIFYRKYNTHDRMLEYLEAESQRRDTIAQAVLKIKIMEEYRKKSLLEMISSAEKQRSIRSAPSRLGNQ